MKLAAAQPLSELRDLIKNRFAEFNRHSSPTRGRKYPPELRELVCRGGAAGIRKSDLRRLTGMSETAITTALIKAKAKLPIPRRLEVVGLPVESQPKPIPLIIRLPSGVTIELAHQEMLTAALLGALSSMEVNHVASC
jgi:hypothetical protein